MKKTFQTGSGCYTCRGCGKKTRDTGDEGDVGLCRGCYDAAGMENAHNDGYHDQTPDPGCPACQAASATRIRRENGMNHNSIQREAENQLAEAMMDNFSPEAVAAIAAHLQAATTPSDDANDQIAWLVEQLIQMLGAEEYGRLCDQLGL